MTTTADIIKEIQLAPDGMTAPELQKKLGIPRGTATSRTATLAKQGHIATLGRRGKARVYYAGSAPKKVTRNHVILVVDRSFSMNDGHPQRKYEAANAIITQQLAPFNEARDQETFVSIYEFGLETSGGTHSVLAYMKSMPSPVAYAAGRGIGDTPLYDGVVTACKEAGEADKREDVSFLVLVVTDGQENASKKFNQRDVRELIDAGQRAGNWTFAFLVPKGGKETATRHGIPEGNVREWDSATAKAVEREVKTSAKCFVEQRRRGVRQVRHYFKADISNLDGSLGLLSNLTQKVFVWTVDKEMDFDQFATEKNFSGKGLRKRFYELMKKEKRIPADREILVLDRRDGMVYGDGQKTIRSLFGWPTTGEVAVDVGNHGNFAILVESRSSKEATHRARILPRGTKAAAY